MPLYIYIKREREREREREKQETSLFKKNLHVFCSKMEQEVNKQEFFKILNHRAQCKQQQQQQKIKNSQIS